MTQDGILGALGPLAKVEGFHCLYPLMAFSMLLALTSCRQHTTHEPALSVQQQLTPQPARVGPSNLTFQLSDQQQKPIAHAIIDVEADMAHPGMTPIFGKVEETSPGAYRSTLDLNMPGDWVIQLHIKLPTGETVERQIDVKGVRPN